MSRIGIKPIILPNGVTASFDKDQSKLTIKGPKGELRQNIDSTIVLNITASELTLSRKNDSKKAKSFHGLYRALLSNMVTGVSSGFSKSLELVGTGYKANAVGNLLELELGSSHNVFFLIPSELSVEVESVKGKNPVVNLKGSDLQLLGQVCAKIRLLRKPEPYKGKGVRFVGENIKLKAGKAAGKK
jgi:large subunit ribosomal protein L6